VAEIKQVVAWFQTDLRSIIQKVAYWSRNFILFVPGISKSGKLVTLTLNPYLHCLLDQDRACGS